MCVFPLGRSHVLELQGLNIRHNKYIYMCVFPMGRSHVPELQGLNIRQNNIYICVCFLWEDHMYWSYKVSILGTINIYVCFR